MAVVAAVTGHASTGGFLLALCHDYGVMRADHGVLYMSEVDIGLPLLPYFMALLCAKSTTAHALRDVVLRGRKIRAPEAKEMGIVDVVCPGAPETAAEELPARKWDGAVYASIGISIFLRPGGACGHCGGSGPSSSFSVAHPAAPHHGSTLPRRHTEEVGRNWLIDAQSPTRFGFGIASGGNGATTVSATMFFAHKVGIQIFVTGGIGGVHRHGEKSATYAVALQENNVGIMIKKEKKYKTF